MSAARSLRVMIETPPLLQQVLAPSSEAATRICANVGEQLGALADRLGAAIACYVETTPAPLPGRTALTGWFRIRVGETVCPVTRDQLRGAYSLTRNVPTEPARPDEIARWLEAQAEGPDTRALENFVTELVVDAVRRESAVLLDPAAGGEAVKTAAAPDRPLDAVFIHVAEAMLRRLTMLVDFDREVFTRLREALFHEAGLRFPDFRFEADAGLAEGHFAFRINGVLGMTRVGLESDEQFVSTAAQQLRLMTDGHGIRPVANPYDGADFAAVTPPLPPDTVSRLRLTSWTPLEYIILCLGAELRHRASTLMDVTWMRTELARLEGYFPALVRIARLRHDEAAMLAVFRQLAAENLSIRDLRQILWALATFETIEADAAEYIVVDERLPVGAGPGGVHDLVAAVRKSMARQVTSTALAGASQLAVLLLDRDLEDEFRERLRAETLGDKAWSGAVLDAVSAELGHASQTLSVLTCLDVRHAVRSVIAREMPRLMVLAYEDLLADVAITPVSRVRLTG